MYLAGIIPGPKEPHLTDLNYYLRPLIDDMVVAWERGVRFSRTALHPNGRTTRSAIVAAVNDLPGARKVSAFAGIGSHFYCTVCECYDKTTLGRHDHNKWKKHDNAEMRRHAERWKNASSSAERETIFQKHGIRWSEMWRIPYWDPSRQLVIDMMHCILEGLVEDHVRDNLALTTASAKARPQLLPAFTQNFRPARANENMTAKEATQVSNIHIMLMAPIEGETEAEIRMHFSNMHRSLNNKNKAALEYVGSDLGITFSKVRIVKSDWATALVEWVSSTSPQQISIRLTSLFSERRNLYG
jgi:hypothetical protein